MRNEILLILSVLLIYGSVIFFYYLFGKSGLNCWTVFACITANIEVLILINAFGMEQTLGNVMFASSFLVTDILSETSGKEAAQKAVNIGIATSIAFILISQLWLLYTPSPNDWASPSFHAIFSNTPRLMLASFLVYAITQRIDVYLYHAWWSFTNKKFHDTQKYLWLRNNGSTLLSQLLNTIFYTFGAFAGVYSRDTLIHICISSYVIFIITSLLDTPFVYLARKITPRFETSKEISL